VYSLLKNILASKKAISPILATLLLIVIAVAAVIVTYAWVMTFTGTQTQQAGVMLIKENVSWHSSKSYIAVVIRNTGTSNGKIMGAYVGTTATNLASVTMNPTSGTVIAGSSASFNLTQTWVISTRYYFKFVTDTPATLEFNEISPAS